MSTLIAAYTEGKKHPRVCSALCYDAKHPGCKCICGGVNHQKGLLHAAVKVQEVISTFVEGKFIRVKTPSIQLPMQGGAATT